MRGPVGKPGRMIGRWALALLIGGATAAAVWPYMTLDPGLSRVTPNPAVPWHYPLLIAHIFASFVALAVGWLQFIPSLRERRARVHRRIGRLYLGCIAVGGLTGLAVGALTASYVRQLAFLALAALWLFTGWKGYRAAAGRRFGEHGRWMVRSYALTLVAATARIVAPLCILLYAATRGGLPANGIEPLLEQVLQANIWLGMVLNLVVAEWAVIRKTDDAE